MIFFNEKIKTSKKENKYTRGSESDNYCLKHRSIEGLDWNPVF